jgi:putative spermidine/putrescine transport system ATP-binding protein
MARVELRHLSKAFGAVQAIHDLSLDIAPGECLALLRPSGSGKTTTLNLVAGFLDLDAGEIRVDGQPITGLPPNRRPSPASSRRSTRW